ncbi:hypothetical protein IFR05_015972 [Cadophora sp. M221]|nr:hypothetical protein IFR05_015972 [Cadophora sp. M221]
MAPSASSPAFIQTVSPGHYYIQSYAATRPGSFRTDLLDFLEAVAYLPKEKRAPLMEYFKKALDCKRRFRLPTPKNNKPGQEGLSQKLATFTLFPKLPLELRTMVWKLALPGCRILEMHYFGPWCLGRSWDAKKSQKAVLHIAKSCTEANRVVAKRYITLPIRELQGKAIHDSTDYDSSMLYRQQTYFVDYQQDIFYFPLGNMDILLRAAGDWEFALTVLSRVTQIAFSIPAFLYKQDCRTMHPKDFEKLKALRNVLFIGDCERELQARMAVGYSTIESEFEALDREDALPIGRTEFEEEPDHPFIELNKSAIHKIKNLLADDTVREAYKNIKVGFEIWRR